MNGRRRRQRNWLRLWLVLIGVPILAYLAYAFGIVLVMSEFD